MPDYLAGTALWAPESDAYAVDPATLPIPPALAARLAAWAEAYDTGFNPEDPLASGFATEAELVEFQAEGAALRAALEKARPDVKVELKL